jgi:hypothetical protein
VDNNVTLEKGCIKTAPSESRDRQLTLKMSTKFLVPEPIRDIELLGMLGILKEMFTLNIGNEFFIRNIKKNFYFKKFLIPNFTVLCLPKGSPKKPQTIRQTTRPAKIAIQKIDAASKQIGQPRSIGKNILLILCYQNVAFESAPHSSAAHK